MMFRFRPSCGLDEVMIAESRRNPCFVAPLNPKKARSSSSVLFLKFPTMPFSDACLAPKSKRSLKILKHSVKSDYSNART